MKQTFNGYIDNPMGKGAVMNQKKMIQQSFETKYGQVLLKEAGKFTCYIFKPTKDGKYYIHIKVPSESTEKLYYDVVVQFYPSNEVKSESTLNNYFCRFYANDPAFVYTYANAFKSQDLLIKELSGKMSKLALKNSANMRNPNSNIGYVKSIYFAYLYMKGHNLFNKALYDMNGIDFNINELRSNVMHADDKIKESQEINDKVKKEKRLEKFKKYQDTKNTTNNNTKTSNAIKRTSQTNKVGRVKNVRSTKRTKR